jgi:hypothetical protein
LLQRTGSTTAREQVALVAAARATGPPGAGAGGAGRGRGGRAAVAELPRPDPYRFAAGLLAVAGGTLREARVTRLAEGTFYAEAVVDGPGGQERVDARPSDALNLALLLGAPVQVEAAVLADAAASRPASPGWGEDLPDGAAEIVTRRHAEWKQTMAAFAKAREQER